MSVHCISTMKSMTHSKWMPSVTNGCIWGSNSNSCLFIPKWIFAFPSEYPFSQNDFFSWAAQKLILEVAPDHFIFHFIFFLKTLDVMVNLWHYKNKQWLAIISTTPYNSQMAQYSQFSDNISTTENRTHNILLLLQTQVIMEDRWKPWEGTNKEKYIEEMKVFLLYEQEG